MAEASKPSLAELLERHHAELVRHLRREGSGLLRYESAEDLAQGAALHALRVADRFEYLGDAAFMGWIRAIGRQHIANRTAYWRALKRNAGPMLRVTFGDTTDPGSGSGVNPEARLTGPATFADRRARLEIATSALALLPARDRELVEAICRGLSIDETAERLDITAAAAQRARLRAQERFKKTYELALRRRGGA